MSRSDALRWIRERRPAVVRSLLLLVVGLGLVSFVAETRSFVGDEVVLRLSGLTEVRSLATWLSVTVLFISAGLALLASDLDPDRSVYWRSGAFISTVLSMEEVVGLHELQEPIRRGIDPLADRPSIAWLAAELTVAVILAAVLLAFISRLRRDVRWRFTAAMALVVTGAIGLQFLGETIAFTRGIDSISFIAIHTLEEQVELAGFIVLLDALALFVGSFHTFDQGEDATARQPAV